MPRKSSYAQRNCGCSAFTGQVQAAIAAALADGGASIERIARSLGISEASLYRQLRACGVSYAELARAVRYQLALAHLGEPDLKLTDIALLLGYSELSAFSRAFRGWTGVAPMAFRQQRGAGVTAASAATAP